MATSSSNPATPKYPKITLYWLEKSRAQRVVWLLEELHLPYELKIFHRMPSGRAPDELKQVHPLGKSPVLSIQPSQTADPIILAESGLIIQYLCEAYGLHLLPSKFASPGTNVGPESVGKETEAWRRNVFYMHFSEGSLMPLLVLRLLFTKIQEASPFFVRPIASAIAGKVEDSYLKPNLEGQLNFLESQMASSGGDWLCGKDLAAADFVMSFPLQACQTSAGMTPNKYPKLCAYVDRLKNTDAYKRGIARIGARGGDSEANL